MPSARTINRTVVDFRPMREQDKYSLPSGYAEGIANHAEENDCPLAEFLTRSIEWAFQQLIIQGQAPDPGEP